MIQLYSKMVNIIKKFFDENLEDDGLLFELFNQCITVVHPYDEQYIRLLNLVFKKFQAQDLNRRAIQAGKLILLNMYENRSMFDPKIAYFEMRLAKICANMKNIDDAEKHVTRAKEIVRVAYGDDNPDAMKEIQMICRKIIESIEDQG